jgi:hypothetical protein
MSAQTKCQVIVTRKANVIAQCQLELTAPEWLTNWDAVLQCAYRQANKRRVSGDSYQIQLGTLPGRYADHKTGELLKSSGLNVR